MGESYMYQRLPYTRGKEEGEDEDEEESAGSIRESVGGQMVNTKVLVGHAMILLHSVNTVCLSVLVCVSEIKRCVLEFKCDCDHVCIDRDCRAATGLYFDFNSNKSFSSAVHSLFLKCCETSSG